MEGGIQDDDGIRTRLKGAERLLQFHEDLLGPLLDPSSPLGDSLRWLIRNDSSEDRKVRFHVASVRKDSGKPQGELHVFELVPGPPPRSGECGSLVAHPLNYLGGGGDQLFNESLGFAFRFAWERAGEGAPPVVVYRWLGYAGEKIVTPGNRWEGTSASGAFHLALMEYFDSRKCYQGLIVMASIDRNGNIQRVEGVLDKIHAVVSFNRRIKMEKLLEMLPIDTVALTKENHQEVIRSFTAEKDPGLAWHVVESHE